MLINHLFMSPPGKKQGLGSLAGTAWVLSAPLGTASDLKVLRTRQDQASRSNPYGTTERYHCVCSSAQLHVCRIVPANSARPACLQTTTGRCPCPFTSSTRLLSPPSHSISVANASAGSRCQRWAGSELVLSALSIPDPILPTAASESELYQLSLGRRKTAHPEKESRY